MAEFQPFNLGQVLMTAEGIKAARSQSTVDRLREQYMGEQIKTAQFQRESAERQQNIVLGKEKAQQIVAKTGQILQQQNPKNYVEQFEPDLVKNLTSQGVDWATVDDEQLKQMVTAMQNRANQELGVAPVQQMETIEGPNGAVLQRDPTTGALSQVMAPQRPDRFHEQQAAADRRAREQREFMAEQNRLNREAAAAKDNSKENDTQEEKQRTWNVYQTARDSLMGAMSATETGPLAGRLPAVTAAQQTAEGSIAAMAPVLKQLFRSAGEGVFTDRDQALLLDMVPKRTDEPEARKNKMENIDAIVRAKLGMQSSPQPQREVTATGPDGQKIVLRNGQWVPM